MDIIKQRLTEAINNSHMTKKDIAQQVGVSSSMITQYVNRDKMPDIYTFARLCKVLEVSANYILGLNDEFY